ncbi:MAG TPA: hypothetical protein VLZ83_13030 [Edaphocola sp.]|nr:hypothetical protein [Edaphocola sp.]
MKYILVLIVLFTHFYAIGQHKDSMDSKQPSIELITRFGSSLNYQPIIFINNKLYNGKVSKINPNKIGVIFGEGDSSYVIRTFGNGPDTSLIRQYFGEQRNRGVLFIFTKDKVKIVSKKKLLQCFKDERYKVIFKVNNAPLVNNPAELDLDKIDKIQIVKEFKLERWDTKEEDEFILFVISYSK